MKIGDLVTFKNDRTVIGSIVKIGKLSDHVASGASRQPVWVMWGFLDGEIEREDVHALEIINVKK